MSFDIWWRGPSWLPLDPSQWPEQSCVQYGKLPEEEREICLVLTVDPDHPLFPINRYSMFTRVTAWVIRFLNNCRIGQNDVTLVNSLLIPELVKDENYWISLSQCACFPGRN